MGGDRGMSSIQFLFGFWNLFNFANGKAPYLYLIHGAIRRYLHLKNLQAMAKDPKNYYQDTPKQIRGKIRAFMSIPEQYNEYRNSKKKQTAMDMSWTPQWYIDRTLHFATKLAQSYWKHPEFPVVFLTPWNITLYNMPEQSISMWDCPSFTLTNSQAAMRLDCLMMSFFKIIVSCIQERICMF